MNGWGFLSCIILFIIYTRPPPFNEISPCGETEVQVGGILQSHALLMICCRKHSRFSVGKVALKGRRAGLDKNPHTPFHQKTAASLRPLYFYVLLSQLDHKFLTW